MNGYSWLLALLVGILAAGFLGAGPDPEPAAVLSRLATQRRDAARKTYEVMWANFRDRRVADEVLYRWSLRWLEAEQKLSERQADQVAACKAHLDRMRELERLIRNIQRTGQIAIDEVSASEFYRVEAEIWLLQAKDGKKNR
jgi:hypothetical protein